MKKEKNMMKEKRKNLFCPTGHQGGFLLTPFFGDTLLISHFEGRLGVSAMNSKLWQTVIKGNSNTKISLFCECPAYRKDLSSLRVTEMGGFVAFYHSKEIDPFHKCTCILHTPSKKYTCCPHQDVQTGMPYV